MVEHRDIAAPVATPIFWQRCGGRFRTWSSTSPFGLRALRASTSRHSPRAPRLAPSRCCASRNCVDLQAKAPPFGGLTATPVSSLARLFVSPGPIFDPEGHGRDWWGAAKALAAAGVGAQDIVLNTFSYHLTPAGAMFESGAHALGCAVIPAGPGNTADQLVAIAQFQPTVYIGTPDFLKILLDKAREAKLSSSIRRAVVSGAALPPSLRAELADAASRSSSATARPISASSPTRMAARAWPSTMASCSKSSAPEPTIRCPMARSARSSSPASTATIR